ncbi:MAG: M20/M25/M40 family metallo-hydrolase [Chitinophagaceae bacterium]|jgi:hypothetical protein|nr:M20/M25/M40 family metallo-hydrolase [Chitinophagaceae bacterium]
MKKFFAVSIYTFLFATGLFAQNAVVNNIVKEETENSMLEKMAHELFDVIGPRLVGTPQMKMANDWVVSKYKEWNINARNEAWGQWRGWERGITRIDMLTPRVRTLEGTQLAWCPSTKGKTITAETIVLADMPDSIAFAKWLPNVKGKFVLISMLQPTGRPEENWKEWTSKENVDKMNQLEKQVSDDWQKRIKNTGYTARTLPPALEKAGAAGVVINNWSKGFGVDKVFGAATKTIPTIDIALEDYGLLYRLTESGNHPTISVQTDSKELGVVPTLNSIAEVKGSEKPNEYVMLSAHLDSWDAGSGATDNGTGTLVMMEAMRLLKKFYPNPKRTIIAGHWCSEEQGLNGSRAFVEDHPNVVNNLQALFNQDNGTGRVVNISGQGFTHAGEFISRWLSVVPDFIKDSIKTVFPGTPSGGGSDNASFVAAGAPGFSLSSKSWSYFNYTWHTNRDTYDKIIFDEVRYNAMLAAILVYMACEDEQTLSHEKTSPLINERTGQPMQWPEQRKPIRKGGLD